MITLNADQIAALQSVRPHVSYRRSLDPAALARKARRTASFNNSITEGLRHAKRTRLNAI